MGIRVEYNPDLALRNISHFQSGQREEEECIPAKLVPGKVYKFLKSGQRNYWLEGQVPLLQTEGNSQLSDPLASIIILEATHFLDHGQVFTKGKYKVIEVFEEKKIYFNGFKKIDR